MQAYVLYTCPNNRDDYILVKTRMVSCNNNKEELWLLCQCTKTLQLDVRYKECYTHFKTTNKSFNIIYDKGGLVRIATAQKLCLPQTGSKRHKK